MGLLVRRRRPLMRLAAGAVLARGVYRDVEGANFSAVHLAPVPAYTPPHPVEP
jgi:hypothetical protein